MLPTVLAATATVLGVVVLGVLLYSMRRPRVESPVQEIPQEPFRVILQEFAIRLADVEARVGSLRKSLEHDMKDVANAAERARYHADRSADRAAELKELLGIAEEDEGGSGDDEGSSYPQGVLPLRAGLEDRAGDDERARYDAVDPYELARMNGA